MIKILYLYEHLRIGGAEQLLLTTLKFLDRNKFYPVVYCLSEKGQIGSEIEKIGVKVRALKKDIHLFNVSIIYDLIRIFKHEKPDAIHTNLFFPNVFGRLAAKLARVKTVITTLHNPDYSFEDNGKMRFKIRKAIDKGSARFSKTSFIAVSEFVKNDFLKQLKFNNTEVIYNYIDVESFKSRDSLKIKEKRDELGFRSEDVLILNVGRLHPQKGQLYLLEAFNLASKDNPRLKLIIIGKGNLEEELKNKVTDSSLKERVMFLEDRRDIAEIMAASDIFVFPSLYEGFGIALVEAMAVGLPIIASDIDSLKEIVSDRKEAILVQKQNPKILADAISELVRDEKLRRHLGENARKKAFELFNAKGLVRKLQTFYEERLTNA
ncbi:MAG: glycosyltransferase [Candidatus Omnitrophica bacterium]|nr:glycosyltransferase [Candidatus Omnitrophota bacterium]